MKGCSGYLLHSIQSYLEGAVKIHYLSFLQEDKEVADSASHFTGFRPADRLSDCL